MNANSGERCGTGLVMETVRMENVPNPSVCFGNRPGRWCQLYFAVKKLGLGERHAIKVQLQGKQELWAARGALRKFAEREGLRVLSSRTDDYREGYFWLVRPERDATAPGG